MILDSLYFDREFFCAFILDFVEKYGLCVAGSAVQSLKEVFHHTLDHTTADWANTKHLISFTGVRSSISNYRAIDAF